MILVYDVETTGLPDWKKPSLDPSQPRVIQLGAMLCDDTGTEIERINRIIKPDGWTIPDEIFQLTGISQGLAESDGVPIAGVIDEFLVMVDKSNVTVAHNDSFDRRLLRIELLRLFGDGAISEKWKISPHFCTMRAGTDLCKLPSTGKMQAAGFNKYKPPKLVELYEHLFGTKPEKMHDAMADVESTAKIYFELMRRKN